MRTVRLIHWNEKEAKGRSKLIRAEGYVVAWQVPRGLSLLRELRENPPAAVVIDLSRLPAQGRDMGLAVRHQKATRNIPLVFVGGLPEKVARVKASVPDAAYTSWEHIGSALKKAIAHPPAKPVVPKSVLEGYAGTPLPKKLGLKPNSVIGLVNAPKGFARALAPLPDGVRVKRGSGISSDVTLWFVKSKGELARNIRRYANGIGDGKLWIVWPKKSSAVTTDLVQQDVRKAGLSVGLVDYKICAIDETWSGLLFTRRKT